jgi:hypothetical protein
VFDSFGLHNLNEGIAIMNRSSSKSVAGAEECRQKLSDQEWVEKYCAAFRVYLQDCTSFDIDAAFFRRDRDAKAVYLRDGQTKAIAKERAAKKQGLPFANLHMRLMFVEHPNNWRTCDYCQGQNVDHPRCEHCKGAGYKIPMMPQIPKNFR